MSDKKKTTKTKKASSTFGKGRKGITTGLKVAEFWLKILRANFTAHLSDLKLAALITKEFPSSTSYDVKDVATHRGLFNHGKIRFQTAVPPGPLSRYDTEGKALPIWGSGKNRIENKIRAHKPKRMDDIQFGSKPIVRVKRIKKSA